MSVSANALTSLALVQAYLRQTGQTNVAPALSVYNDALAGSAATLGLIGNTLTLTETGGAGIVTFDLTNASYDTLGELVTAINAAAGGWVATLIGPSAVASSTLLPINPAADVRGAGNTIQLSTSADYLLERLIDATSALMESYCSRRWKERTYREWYEYPWTGKLVLRNHPVTSVSYVSFGTSPGIRIMNSGGGATARVSLDDTNLTLTRVASGVESTSTLALTTYPTLTALVNAVSALGNGWSAAAEAADPSYPSAELRRVYGLNAHDEWAYIDIPADPSDADFYLEAGSAILHLSTGRGSITTGIGCDGGEVYVKYAAGYSTIPADVEMLATEIVAEAYKRSLRGGEAAGESLDGYTYNVGITVQMDATLRGRLERYKNELYSELIFA